MLCNAYNILTTIENHLGIKAGQTTPVLFFCFSLW